MSFDEMTALAMRDVAKLEREVARLREALSEIALAGMSGTGQESEEGMRDWHARRAWEFIGIAARALSPAAGVLGTFNYPERHAPAGSPATPTSETTVGVQGTFNDEEKKHG